MNNFLDFLKNNPKVYFYDKVTKQVLKHIKEHHKLKITDLNPLSFFEIHKMDIDIANKKLEFVLKINCGLETPIECNLYTFTVDNKLHFLTVYRNDDNDFDLYNFCGAWCVLENEGV